MKKTLSIFLMIAVTLSCIISYPAVSPATQVHAASKVKVVIVDSGSKEWQTKQLKRWLKKNGISYDYKGTSDVDPAKYDGLIIPGGADISRALYDKNYCTKTGKTANSRDKMQKKVILNFKKIDKPILGICRGCQMINVALGGNLIQDLGGHKHRNHTITISSNSWLRKAYGATETVRCNHHQAVKKLGKGMIKTARKGRIVEAIQHETLPIYGVQFHPELKGKYGEAALAKQFKRTCLSVKKKSRPKLSKCKRQSSRSLVKSP